jgi:hypothetical protein
MDENVETMGVRMGKLFINFGTNPETAVKNS